MAFKKKQQGRTSESDGGSADDDAPPLPARSGDICNGTNSARSLSFSSKDGGLSLPAGPPPPIPSRPSTGTSSRSNSIGGVAVVDSSSPRNIGAGPSSNVSSLLTRITNNPSTSDCPSHTSILGTSSVASYSATATAVDRVNPFDKNVISSEAAAAGASTGTGSGPSSSLSDATKDFAGTTLDDLIKNRFAKQQGVQDEATGRYKPKLSEVKGEPSFEDMKNELFRKEEKRPERKFSETDSVFSSSPKPITSAPVWDPTSTPSPSPASAATSKFSKFSRTNSSDADIIFGSATAVPSARPKYNYSVDSQSSISSETDNIFTKKEEGRQFIKSLSVSSSDDREFSADPRVRNYDGIQNAAFQDYDSTSFGSRGTLDSGIGVLRTTTGSTSSGTSSSVSPSPYKWSSSRLAEEEFEDLK